MLEQTSIPKLARSNALRYFAEVAEKGSFRAAAESLHIAASAINRQVSNLEEDVGVKLFERARGRAGLRLTEAGRILHFRLRSAINELRIANDEIVALQGLQRGHVVLGVNEGLAGNLIPRAVRNFRDLYPNITFSIKVDNTRGLVQRLREGEIDFAVGYNFPLNPDIEYVEKRSFRMYLITAPGHPLTENQTITIDDLRRTDLILPDSSLLIRQVFDYAMQNSKANLNPVVETNSFDLIYSLVECGLGVSIVTGRTDMTEARSNVRYIAIDCAFMPNNDLGCCRLRDRSVSAAATAFITHIRNVLRLIHLD